MASRTVGLFVPGFGAPARAYAPGLPAGWTALEPPAFRHVRGSFEAYRAFDTRGRRMSGYLRGVMGTAVS